MVPQQRTNLPKVLNGTKVEVKYKNYQFTPNKLLVYIVCKAFCSEKKLNTYFPMYGQKQDTGYAQPQLRDVTLTALSTVSIYGTSSENVSWY